MFHCPNSDHAPVVVSKSVNQPACAKIHRVTRRHVQSSLRERLPRKAFVTHVHTPPSLLLQLRLLSLSRLCAQHGQLTAGFHRD